MQIVVIEEDGVAGLECRTDGSAGKLSRDDVGEHLEAKGFWVGAHRQEAMQPRRDELEARGVHPGIGERDPEMRTRISAPRKWPS